LWLQRDGYFCFHDRRTTSQPRVLIRIVHGAAGGRLGATMATVTGTNGNDVLNAASLPQGTTPNADFIFGFAGNDLIQRSGGDDVIDGGEGFDAVDYSDTVNRVVVSLSNGTLREFSPDGVLRKADRLYAIEEVRTGNGDDSLSGSGADEVFAPGRGNDAVVGGEGIDSVSYAAATSRVLVDLARGFARDWGQGTDSLSGIEGARGGQGSDVLVGGADFSLLRGNAGADTIVSGWDGRSPTRGNVGIDHAADPAGVLVDLAAGVALDGWGSTDLLQGRFRSIVGSVHADTLRGDAGNNVFRPRGGADVIEGGGGFDRLDFRDEPNADPDGDGFVVTAVLGADGRIAARDASGALDHAGGIELLRGSPFRDSLSAVGPGGVVFGALFVMPDAPIELEGWAGDDLLVGAFGTGVIARYGADEGSIVADLAAGFVLDNFGFRDTLIGVWGIAGSAQGDVILLTGAGDYARPGAGADLVDGRAGIDQVDYGDAPAGITADLAAGTVADGWGSIDTLRYAGAAQGVIVSLALHCGARPFWPGWHVAPPAMPARSLHHQTPGLKT
jgi:hypothetical protein